jgi:hypothetical protein
MVNTVKVPSGRQILKTVLQELMLNLYPLPFTTLPLTVYHVYLHPDDFSKIEGIVPRIVAQVQRALTAEVERVNRSQGRRGRAVLRRLIEREEFAAIEIPQAGWEVNIQPDCNGELHPGELGIVSAMALPTPPEYGGPPTTRIVKTVVGDGRRSSATTEVPQPATSASPPTEPVHDGRERARLTYEDEQGAHTFGIRKDRVSVGRGGSSAWVDVQVMTSSKVSREHFRIRRDTSGKFFIQDVSLWGTSVDGNPLPPAVKTTEGVVQPGPERELPPAARIDLADALAMQFEATPSSSDGPGV